MDPQEALFDDDGFSTLLEGNLNPTYFSALAAPAGATIGGLTSFATLPIGQPRTLQGLKFEDEPIRPCCSGFGAATPPIGTAISNHSLVKGPDAACS